MEREQMRGKSKSKSKTGRESDEARRESGEPTINIHGGDCPPEVAKSSPAARNARKGKRR